MAIENANAEFADFEIRIVHEGPLSFGVVQTVIASLQRAVFNANLAEFERLSGVLADAGIGTNLEQPFYRFARQALEDNADRLIWIDEVRSGSTTIKGRFLKNGKWVVIWFLSNVSGDVLDQQQWYKELIDAINSGSHHVIERVVESIKRGASGPDQKDASIEVDIVADRVRIIVHPSKRHTDMTLSPPSSK